MNPFLYKAHPLLRRLISLFVDPHSSSLTDKAELIALMLALNLLWAPGLVWAAWQVDRLRLPLVKGYLLALPASLLYTPMVLTVVNDVAAQGFRFQDRFLLVFAIFVVSQMLTAFYAFALRHRPSGYPVGLGAGATLSLFLLLYSLAISLGLLGVGRVFKIL